MSDTRDRIERLRQVMGRSIVGQEAVVDRLLLTLLCNGNLLLEGLPGLAKTRAIKGLAANLEAEFSRIQFTPDLLPSDITGSEMYLGEDSTERFEFRAGPIFANIVLADEINRAPAKVQAALLEAMEERQVTVAGETHAMPPLFMVMATQNPIEQEGTYPLPEAQMDRFLMHVTMTYPSTDDEVEVIRLVRGETAGTDAPPPLGIAQDTIFQARREIDAIRSSDAIDRYVVALIDATRHPEKYGDALAGSVTVGASPRGGLALDKASRAHAWLKGRDLVLPEDVQAIAHDCLRHRVMPSYEAIADGRSSDSILTELLDLVAVA